MKELVDVINEIKFGSVLFIDSQISKNINIYTGYIREYDGDIFLDVKTVKIGNLLESLPNIKLLLDKGYIYQITYDLENKIYESSIYKGDFNSSKKEIVLEEDSTIFTAQGNKLLDTFINLDTEIANSVVNESNKQKMQIYA